MEKILCSLLYVRNGLKDLKIVRKIVNHFLVVQAKIGNKLELLLNNNLAQTLKELGVNKSTISCL